MQEKRRVHALANQQLITESTWLKRLVVNALCGTAESVPDLIGSSRPAETVARNARLYVRLRPEDRLLLRERAAARGMPPATYVSVLVRAHLRRLAPLPKEELTALKRSVAELGAIGRNLNQIARAANQDVRAPGPAANDLRAMLKVCGALRDHVKGVIKANADSWELGHGEAAR
jgi:hypothetical protein